MRISWARADPPLPAVAVAANGESARRLLQKGARDSRWSVTHFDEWTVVCGHDLPWVEEAVYLGRLPGAAHVLTPVHRVPQLHPELIERASAIFRDGASLAAVIPHGDGVTVLPLPGS